MNDCSNAEIRDQLPDLLNGRLDVSARAAVIAHVDGCVDCREELALLRGMLDVLLVSAPQVDVAQIVRSLPKPPAARMPSMAGVRPLRARRPMRMDWRIAAVVTLIAVGGGSYSLLQQHT